MVVEPADYLELADYLSRAWQVGDPAFWLDRFRVWWELNPAYPTSWDRGYLLRSDDSKIVGFIGNIPYLLQLNFQEVTITVSTSWYIEPEYRSGAGGIELLLKQVEFSERNLLLTDTASRNTAKIMERLRFSTLPAPSKRQSFFLADPYAIFQSRLSSKGVPAILIQGLSLVYGLAQKLFWRLGKPKPKLKTEILLEANAQFDQLWERTRGNFATTAVRNSAQVTWYCFSSHSQCKCVIGAYDEGGQLVGYIVLNPRTSYHYRILECLDYWQDTTQTDCALALIHHSVQACRQLGYAALQMNQIPGPLESALQQVGLFSRLGAGPSLVYLPGDSLGKDPLRGNCFISELVGDRGL